MAPSKWDDEEESSSDSSTAPAPAAGVRHRKFEDEEDDSDVLDSWDKAEDSEEEAAKAKAAEAAKAKAEADARANKKSKSQRIEEKRMEAMRRREAEEDESDEESEDENERRARLRREQKESDLKHAEELFGGVGKPVGFVREKAITVQDGDDPTSAVDLSKLSIFSPTTRDQFTQLRETLIPLVNSNAKKAPYTLFATEFAKGIAKDLPSDQIKKIASALTTLSNEKLAAEKVAEKGGKKTKAAKSKTSLNASRNLASTADTSAYDDGLDDGDFM